MQKTILITGSTDGIGLETAKVLLSEGHRVLLHGRNAAKLEGVEKGLGAQFSKEQIGSYVSDLSNLKDVELLAQAVSDRHQRLDVLINNAGIFKTPSSMTEDGLDVRFVVNTIAPYRLTLKLMPLLGEGSRVISLSSAAQESVNTQALLGQTSLPDMPAYAQSKLALTIWSKWLAAKRQDSGPIFISVNPGSLLASKMVKEGFGIVGNDLSIGADILSRLSIADEFTGANGLYFDNDIGRFTEPHSDAADEQITVAVIQAIESILEQRGRNEK